MTTSVLVLGGGDSPEREVSLRSSAAVAAAAEAAGFTVSRHDPADGLDMFDSLSSDTVVLPILHGKGGEDGTIQAELEKRQLKYLGSDSWASRVCFDKNLTRERLLEHALPVAAGGAVTRQTYHEHPLSKQPHVLKVARGGSSIGTLLVRESSRLDPDKLDDVFGLDTEAVIEELVEGVEITVPILGRKALPVIEIVPPDNEEFDYENKYNGKTRELCPPVSISTAVQAKAQKLGEQVHAILGARHLSRIDMIIRPNGEPIVLELNTIPGMSAQSLYPLAAHAAGLSMPQLVERFVRMVQEDT